MQIFRWVIEYDIEHSYNFYLGLIVPAKETDPPDVVRKTKQVKRDINRLGEQEYDLLNEGKTQKEKEDERRFKQEPVSYTHLTLPTIYSV